MQAAGSGPASWSSALGHGPQLPREPEPLCPSKELSAVCAQRWRSGISGGHRGVGRGLWPEPTWAVTSLQGPRGLASIGGHPSSLPRGSAHKAQRGPALGPVWPGAQGTRPHVTFSEWPERQVVTEDSKMVRLTGVDAAGECGQCWPRTRPPAFPGGPSWPRAESSVTLVNAQLPDT